MIAKRMAKRNVEMVRKGDSGREKTEEKDKDGTDEE